MTNSSKINGINGVSTIPFREVITLEKALQRPEADNLKSLHISQLTDDQIRPLAMELLRKDVGILGVNYGDKREKISPVLRESSAT